MRFKLNLYKAKVNPTYITRVNNMEYAVTSIFRGHNEMTAVEMILKLAEEKALKETLKI